MGFEHPAMFECVCLCLKGCIDRRLKFVLRMSDGEMTG